MSIRVLSLLAVAACGANAQVGRPVTINHNGSIEVRDFRYRPAENGAIGARTILRENGEPYEMARDVSQAVRAEVIDGLEAATITFNKQKLVLYGDIEEFVLRDGVDSNGEWDGWTLKINYVVAEQDTGNVVGRPVVKNQSQIAKGMPVEELIAGAIRFNVKDLVRNPEFVQAIRGEISLQ